MTGTAGATGSYIQSGKLVHFWIRVGLTGVTKFGTGAFGLTLPPGLPAASYYSFSAAALIDTVASQIIQMTGTVAPYSSAVNMYYLSWIPSSKYERFNPFTAKDPITLVAGDYFYISGTYITP